MDHARGKRKLETHRAEVPEVALELAVAIIFGRGLPERRQGIFLFAALPGIGDPFTPGGVVPGPQVEEDAAAGGREDGRRSEVLSKREERVRGWRGKGKERERAKRTPGITRQGVLLPYRFRELHFPVLVLIAHEGFPLVAGVLVPHRRALFADHGCGEGECARPRAGEWRSRWKFLPV